MDLKLTKCFHCEKDVPSSNMDLHSLHCLRMLERCNICNKMVAKRFAQQHYKETHGPVKCSLCGQSVERSMVNLHETDQCTHRIVACKYCEYPLPLVDLESHVDMCSNRTQYCHPCGRYVRNCEMSGHVHHDYAEEEYDDYEGEEEYNEYEEEIPMEASSAGEEANVMIEDMPANSSERESDAIEDECGVENSDWATAREEEDNNFKHSYSNGVDCGRGIVEDGRSLGSLGPFEESMPRFEGANEIISITSEHKEVQDGGIEDFTDHKEIHRQGCPHERFLGYSIAPSCVKWGLVGLGAGVAMLLGALFIHRRRL